MFSLRFIHSKNSVKRRDIFTLKMIFIFRPKAIVTSSLPHHFFTILTHIFKSHNTPISATDDNRLSLKTKNKQKTYSPQPIEITSFKRLLIITTNAN